MIQTTVNSHVECQFRMVNKFRHTKQEGKRLDPDNCIVIQNETFSVFP